MSYTRKVQNLAGDPFDVIRSVLEVIPCGITSKPPRHFMAQVSAPLKLKVPNSISDPFDVVWTLPSGSVHQLGKCTTVSNGNSRNVGLVGFEPTTSCSQSRRAAKLRHSPI